MMVPSKGWPARFHLAVIALALLASACTQDDYADAPLSVVLITLDTTRADALGCYGGRSGLTPNLDALAAQSVLYEVARTVAPLTTPAHASMLTGLYPNRHTVRDNGLSPLPRSAVTLAEILHDAGYQTAAFVAADVLASPYGLNQGFDVYAEPMGRKASPTDHMLSLPGTEVTHRARAWLASRDRSRPFFLWVHYFDAHAPYQPPRPFLLRAHGQAYLGAVAAMDASVGTLLRGLGKSHPPERTLIAVVGDHGEALGAHGEKTHSVLCYEELLRIPFTIRYPDGLHAGTRSRETVSVVDLLPTLLDALGMHAPSGIDGRSLYGRTVPKDRGVYFESFTGYLNYGWSPLAGWVDAEGKYVHGTHPEFFTLADDPGEQRNLFAQRKEEIDRYRTALKILAERAPLAREDDESVGEATRERVRQLGYAGAASTAARLPHPLEPTGLPDARDRMSELDAFYAAVLRANEGDRPEAIRQLEALAKDNPNNVYALNVLAMYLFGEQRPQETLRVLFSIPRRGQDRVTVQDLYGHCFEQLGDLAQARARFRRALELKPGDPHQIEDVQRVLAALRPDSETPR